jgi:hypothetical protein
MLSQDILVLVIYATWPLVIIGQLLLLFNVARNKVWKTYPFFSVFVMVATAANLVAVFAYRFFTRENMAIVYYCVSFLCIAVLIAVPVELFLKVYGPSRSRPPVVANKLWVMLAFTYPSCILIGLLWHARSLAPLYNSLRTAEAVALAGIVSTLWIIAFYSRHWGVTWRRYPAGILYGLVLTLSIDFICLLLKGRCAKTAAEILTIIQQCGYLTSLLLWCKCFAIPEKRLTLSATIRSRVRAEFQNVVEAAIDSGIAGVPADR